MKPLPKYVATLEILTGIGLIVFWTAFFTIGLAPENAPPSYLAFEHSFPLPDGVMAIFLFLGGWLSLKQKPLGKLLSLVAAGSLLFLGLVDFSYNIQNGMYLISKADLFMNGFINIWCLGLATLILTKSV